jgi:heme-degrading monooxygenase HmoA
MADPVILINLFEVPAADADAFVAAWEKARDHLRSQRGYLDTVLHQAITPDAEFQFVNIARWRTAEDFIAAAQSPVSASQPRAWPATGRTPPCTSPCGPDRRRPPAPLAGREADAENPRRTRGRLGASSCTATSHTTSSRSAMPLSERARSHLSAAPRSLCVSCQAPRSEASRRQKRTCKRLTGR